MSWKNIPFRTKYIFNGDKNNIVWFPGHMRTGLRKMRHSLKTTGDFSKFNFRNYIGVLLEIYLYLIY